MIINSEDDDDDDYRRDCRAGKIKLIMKKRWL